MIDPMLGELGDRQHGDGIEHPLDLAHIRRPICAGGRKTGRRVAAAYITDGLRDERSKLVDESTKGATVSAAPEMGTEALVRALRPLLLGMVLSAAVPSAAAAQTVRGSSGPLSATLHAGTHHPKVSANWPLQVTASLSGRPAHASIGYQFLYSGQVVSTQIPRYPNGKPHTSFTGSFSDLLQFPARSVGYPLTLQVHIVAGGRAVNLDYALQVIR